MTDYFYSWLDAYKPDDNDDEYYDWEEKGAFLVLPGQVTHGEWYGSLNFRTKEEALKSLDNHIEKLLELRDKLVERTDSVKQCPKCGDTHKEDLFKSFQKIEEFSQFHCANCGNYWDQR